ncbi:MAG: hypothetical protein EA397_10145 [Deltaproteobacteria bacterium]|nr:MAG: hypothetical protein EA397_10145 [Deltaproteobacteria bacterium]
MPELTQKISAAHYLHARSGLEPVLRPPVESPTCLAWRPRSQRLLVGNRGGELFEVEPVDGTIRRAHDLGWITALAVHPDNTRFVTLGAEGTFTIGEISGASTDYIKGQHGFARRMSAMWFQDYAVLTGDTATGREVVLVRDGKVKLRIPVPHRAIPRGSSTGKLELVRSTQAGLMVRTLSRKPAPVDIESTNHVLRCFGDVVLGFTVIGLVVWHGDTAISLRFTDLGVACISPDHEYVGMGTRSGSVAIAKLDTAENRAHPDVVRAGEGPVMAVSFAERGQWLASAGDSLIVWSWED